jgi:hypothetical protein
VEKLKNSAILLFNIFAGITILWAYNKWFNISLDHCSSCNFEKLFQFFSTTFVIFLIISLIVVINILFRKYQKKFKKSQHFLIFILINIITIVIILLSMYCYAWNSLESTINFSNKNTFFYADYELQLELLKNENIYNSKGLLYSIKKNALFYNCDKFRDKKEIICLKIVSLSLYPYIIDENLCEKEVENKKFKNVLSCQKQVLKQTQEQPFLTYYSGYVNMTGYYLRIPLANAFYEYAERTKTIYGADEFNEPNFSCYESDESNNSQIKKYAYYYGLKFYDYCLSENYQREAICINNTLLIKQNYCNCKDGVCI